MSNKICPKCGRQYASSYQSCPYCASRGRRSRPTTWTERILDFIRQYGERIFLISSVVFIAIALVGAFMTRCSTEEAKPEEPPEPPKEDAQPEEPPEPVIPLALSQTSLSLLVDESAQLTATGVDGVPSWSTSDENVASVSGGVITAKAPGTATITISCGLEQATCTVTVTQPEPKVELYLNRTDFTIRKQDGDTFQMLVKEKETRKNYEGAVTWASADTSVVTISETGLVTRVGRGTTTVTATIGSKTLECIVRVS